MPIETFTSSGSWTAPLGVFSVFVECWGAGGYGNTDSGGFPLGGGGAGGGGAYSASTVAVTPGNVYSLTLNFNNCVDLVATIFGSNLVVAASGHCAPANGTGGLGGQVADCIGNTKFDGGDGGSGGAVTNGAGGGGGGCAGPGGPGNAGVNGTTVLGAGGAGDGDLAGAGGAGAEYPATDAVYGGDYGGGGGGGANGGGIEAANAPPGAIRLTYFPIFGTNIDFHQFNNTGPTNNPIPHTNPLNKYTTTKGIGLRRKAILGSVGLLPLPPNLPPCINTQSISHVSTTTTTWTVPPGVTGVLVKAQGEGGNGANAPNCGNGTIGGGGGGYAVSLLPVLPGETYTVTVGSGGTGTDTSFIGPGGTVIGYAGVNYGPGGAALGQYTANGGNSFVPPPYNGAAGGFAGSGAFGGAGGTGGFAGCTFAETVSVTITDANNFPGCTLGPKTLTWVPDEEMENGGSYLGDGDYFPCELGFTSYSGGDCCGDWGQVCLGPLENPTCYSLPDSGNTCGSITLYGSAVHDTYAVVTGLSGSCAAGNPGLPGTLGSGGGGGGGGSPGGTGGQGGAGFIEISWGNPFGLNGETHQTHTTTQTNFTLLHCTPLNQYTTTKGIGLRRKWILGSIALAPNTFLELPCARLTTPVTFVPTEGDINTPWIVPNGVCQILVECQGDGNGFPNGNGSNGSDGVGGYGGPGGHGGGYGSSIINVVPGTIYNVNITEGSGAFFQDQFFTNIVAGYSGDDEIGGGLGDIVYNGNPGGGGSPGYPQVEDNNGGGGNGGMGGTSGYNSSGGLGGLGAGLNGIPPASNGSLAPNYGGGGGGGGGGSGAGETPGFGGTGGMGFVRISWWGFYGLKSPRICGGG